MKDASGKTEFHSKSGKQFCGFFYCLLFVIAGIIVGCSDDNAPNEPNTKPVESVTDSVAVLQNVEAFNSMQQWLEKSDDLSIQQIIDYAKKMQNVEKVEVADSVIDVYTKNGYFFQIDIGDAIEYQEPELDEDAFEKWLEEQDAIYNNTTDENAQSSSDFFGDIVGDEDDGTDAVGADYASMMSGLSRATTYSRKVLLWKKKNLLVWCPWIEFSGDKSFISKLVTKLNAKLNRERRRPINLKILKNGEFGPGNFLQFGKYDMVFVSAHGTGRGNLCVPFRALSRTDSIQYDREVKAKRAGYCMTYLSKADQNKGKVTKSGFSLFNSFFTKYMPELKRTMVWAFVCNAGKPNVYSFHKSVVEHNVAKYFASTSNCGGNDVLNKFANFYAELLNGKSADRAFYGGKQYFKSSFWTEEKGQSVKKEFNFYQFRDNYVCYVVPRATGVRPISSVKAHNGSQLRDASENDIIVGGQIRYGINPILSGDKSNLGVCLKNIDTGLVQYIPLSDENLISSSSKTIGDDIKIHNFEVKLSGLPYKTRFVYAFYATDESQIILSDECYEFSTPDYYGNLNKMEMTIQTNADGWCTIFNFDKDYLDSDDSWENLLRRFYDIGFVAIDYGDGKGIQPFDASKHVLNGVYQHSYQYTSSDETHKITLYYKNIMKEVSWFRCCPILSITIPNTVERIGNGAMVGNVGVSRSPLRQVVIPESVKFIGRYAFAATSIESIVLPNSVTTVSENAFFDCGLNSVSFLNPNCEIGEDAFYGCDKLRKLQLPSNIEEIKKSAFYDCRTLTQLKLPESVEIIDTCAFANCQLKDIVIPNNVKEVRWCAFEGNPLESIELGSNIRHENGFYFSDNLQVVRCYMPSPPKPFSVRDFLSSSEIDSSSKILYVLKQYLNAYLIDFYSENAGVYDVIDYANMWKDKDGNYTYYGEYKIIPF